MTTLPPPTPPVPARLVVAKTLKMYVGGQFIRSESGQTLPLQLLGGPVLNVSRASRKDLRNAVQIARAAQPGWAGRTAYNRGQILYRLAEILDDRAAAIPDPRVALAADRAVHHAGWSDKISAILSTLNPVAGTYINYSRVRPLGVLLAVPDPADGLLGMVEALCAATVMGNSVIVAAAIETAPAAVALAEALATCDMPGGPAAILTGHLDEILKNAALFDDLDGIYLADPACSAERLTHLEREGARVMRRLIRVPGAAEPADPITLQRLAEIQTVWMSAYEPQGGAAAY